MIYHPKFTEFCRFYKKITLHAGQQHLKVPAVLTRVSNGIFSAKNVTHHLFNLIQTTCIAFFPAITNRNILKTDIT